MEARSFAHKGTRLAVASSGLVVVAVALATHFSGGIASRMFPDAQVATTDKTGSGKASPMPGAAPAASATDQRIRAAQQLIERAPADLKGYTLLCTAFMQTARETGDFGYNAKAEAALDRALQISPASSEVLKLQALLLLTFHRFPEALAVARHALELRPHDHDVLGALTDALVELGDYDAAGQAAQAMIDQRPDTASYARVSYLRALHGDRTGAIQAMRLAVQAANPSDPEEVAWCRVHLGYELLYAGQREAAEHEFDWALATFPDFYLALAAKGRARIAAGDIEGAVQFYQRAQNRVPLPDSVATLVDLYTKLGRAADAKREYDLLEFIERAGAAGSTTYSRQLALFWADHDIRLDDALAMARRERVTRNDIYTWDTLAWCLFKKGELAEARSAITAALRLGTNDTRLYYHAGMIYNGLGDRHTAAQYLQRALAADAAFDVLQVDVARRTLEEIGSR